jgi:hypothetical protein
MVAPSPYARCASSEQSPKVGASWAVIAVSSRKALRDLDERAKAVAGEAHGQVRMARASCPAVDRVERIAERGDSFCL